MLPIIPDSFGRARLNPNLNSGFTLNDSDMKSEWKGTICEFAYEIPGTGQACARAKHKSAFYAEDGCMNDFGKCPWRRQTYSNLDNRLNIAGMFLDREIQDIRTSHERN